jgi:hypothetical protein
VANTLDLFRNGAVGFIDWLDAGTTTPKKLGTIHCNTNVLDLGFFEPPLSSALNDVKGIINVAAMFIAAREYLYAIILHGHHAENRFAYVPASRYERLNRVDVCSGDAT